MHKVIALVVVLLVGLLMLRTLAATWLLFLLLAAAFAWGASSRSIGKWGYSAAAVCALMAIPGFFLRVLLKGIGMAFGMLKLFPLLLVLLLGYMIYKSFKK